MPDQVFGQLNSFSDVELALEAHIKQGLNTYLAARERKMGLVAGGIGRPATWWIKQTFAELPPEASTPAIIIVSVGLTDEPHKHGDGNFDVLMGMAVVVLTSGSDTRSSRILAGHYQSAITNLLMKHKKFGSGTARIHQWVDMSTEDIDLPEQTRNYCAARIEFIVKVTDFASSLGGPAVLPSPDPLPPQPDDPEVLTVGTEVKPQ